MEVSTRTRLLTAFRDTLIDSGERAATIEAVAHRAGVSKGGLLYHFATKDAMVEALLEDFVRLVDADVAAMRRAPEGAVAYYLRTAVAEAGELDKIFVAISVLALSASTPASEALRLAQSRWLEAIIEAVGNPDAARAIALIGDGIYFNSTLGAGAPTAAELESLVEMAVALARPTPDPFS